MSRACCIEPGIRTDPAPGGHVCPTTGAPGAAPRCRRRRAAASWRIGRRALMLPSYLGTIHRMKEITRTQTGVRLETRLLKVLKALATELDLSLGDLLEGVVLHAFEGKAPFSAATLRKVKALRAVYGLDLTAKDSHQLREAGEDES